MLINVNIDSGKPELVAMAIKKFNPDFVVLEEVNTKWITDLQPVMVGYSIIFISMFDRDFSAQLYRNFRNVFFKRFLGLDFPMEWITSGHNLGDVDSGPVINGIGTVASAFTIGAAKANNDEYIFSSLSAPAEIATLPYYNVNGTKGYLANVSLGEAVLLFCRTLRPWM
jgi:hypothetical protein